MQISLLHVLFALHNKDFNFLQHPNKAFLSNKVTYEFFRNKLVINVRLDEPAFSLVTVVLP